MHCQLELAIRLQNGNLCNRHQTKPMQRDIATEIDQKTKQKWEELKQEALIKCLTNTDSTNDRDVINLRVAADLLADLDDGVRAEQQALEKAAYPKRA